MFVADALCALRHYGGMLSHRELIDSLKGLKDEGRTTNAALGRLLKIPTSRVAEIFSGTRAVKVDEMKVLVEHFGWDGSPTATPISADLLTPIVNEIAVQAQRIGPGLSARPLAQALARYLQQIGASPAIHANQDALEAVAQAVIPLSPEDTQRA